MYVIGVYNQKGGPGKTTLSVSLAAIFASKNYRTLIIDGDGQISTTQFILSEEEKYFIDGIYQEDQCNLGSLLMGECKTSDCIVRKTYSRFSAFKKYYYDLDIIPGNPKLNYLEINSMYALRAALQEIKDDYDFVFIDMPPSDSQSVAVTLAACDYVLCPSEACIDGFNGFSKEIEFIKDINTQFDTEIRILGLVINRYIGVRKLQQELLSYSKSLDPEIIFNTHIPNDAKVPEARAHNIPLEFYARSCPANKAMHELANEITERIKQDRGEW